MTAGPYPDTAAAPAAVPLLFDREILTTLFICVHKFLLALAERFKTLRLLGYLLVSAIDFLRRRLHPSLWPPFNHSYLYHIKVPKDIYVFSAGADDITDSGIARALTQLLAIARDLPVSSRKYEVVQSLAGGLLDENLLEGSKALREVNLAVLSAAFLRTLGQLEAAVVSRDRSLGSPRGEGEYEATNRYRVVRAVKYYGYAALKRFRKSAEEASQSENWAEKLAAEMLWLAQKMAASGCVEEAVGKWALSTRLAWLALSAEPRLQGSLVKVSAFLFKQAKELKGEEESEREQQRQTKLKMLMSWLPLLCRASNGTDVPVLTMSERAELERVLVETIEMLEREEDQGKVLSLWLHHFTRCASSDWPDLLACYAKWCTASRKRLLPPGGSKIELQMTLAVREELQALLVKSSLGTRLAR